jgi:hypothetical protein
MDTVAEGCFPSCAMFLPLLTFASCLVLVVPVRAQIIAPNCTDPTLAWVGTLCAEARFLFNPLFIYSRSIRSNKVLARSQRTWRRCATMAVGPCIIGASYTISLAFHSIRHPTFATPKFLRRTKWERRQRSVQMQHGSLQPHQRMRCVPRKPVDCVR